MCIFSPSSFMTPKICICFFLKKCCWLFNLRQQKLFQHPPPLALAMLVFPFPPFYFSYGYCVGMDFPPQWHTPIPQTSASADVFSVSLSTFVFHFLLWFSFPQGLIHRTLLLQGPCGVCHFCSPLANVKTVSPDDFSCSCYGYSWFQDLKRVGCGSDSCQERK